MNQLLDSNHSPSPLDVTPLTGVEVKKEPTQGGRVGVVARMDHSGLGYQTKALVEMLKPDKILLIDSTDFRGAEQHPEWYEDCPSVVISRGIPGYLEYEEFFQDIDVMITCETPYTYEAWNWAREAGVRTYCQPNWELFDGLVQPNMPHPDQYLMPSYWHLEDFQKLFPNTIYLPPPSLEMDNALAVNMDRKGKRKFVHIVGTNAIYDRNGWVAIMDCLKETQSDFELHVYSQQDMTGYSDPRVTYFVMDVEQEEMYTDYDALILPRRYGGLCLPMNEALMAGLPVIMTDIEPNNKILPKDWLCESQITDHFEGRSTIDVYSPLNLAKRIDWFCNLSDAQLLEAKCQAYTIALNNYSIFTLKPKYEKLLLNNPKN